MRANYLLAGAMVTAVCLLASLAWADSVTCKVAWMSSADGVNFDIKIMDLDGGNKVNLSRVGDPGNLYSDKDPHFKPDGSRILFTSRRAGDLTDVIYEMDPDGGNVTRLTPSGLEIFYNVSTAKYSWDGTMVVLRRVQPGGPNPVNDLAYFQVSDPGGTMTAIPNTNSMTDFWPAFSPDGRSVVFQRAAGAHAYRICRINLDGTGLVELTDGTHLDEMPCCSPDGSYIIFKRGGTAGENMDIYRMDASDGGNLINLTSSSGGFDSEDAPIYSWEGGLIAYQCDDGGPARTEIFIDAPGGGSPVRLTDDSNYDWNPSFAPVPEPGTMALLVLGGIGVLGRSVRHRRK